MPECCGVDQAGKYCSNCGSPLSLDPIEQLKAHLRDNARKWRKRYEEGLAAGMPPHDKALENVQKWEEWHQALIDLQKQATTATGSVGSAGSASSA